MASNLGAKAGTKKVITWNTATTQAITGSATYTSDWVTMSPGGSGSLAWKWTGGSTPVATVTLQLTDDPTDAAQTKDSGLTGLAISGTTGNDFFGISVSTHQHYRLQIVSASGSATVAAIAWVS
jgi:hypothetical protein